MIQRYLVLTIIIAFNHIHSMEPHLLLMEPNALPADQASPPNSAASPLVLSFGPQALALFATVQAESRDNAHDLVTLHRATVEQADSLLAPLIIPETVPDDAALNDIGRSDDDTLTAKVETPTLKRSAGISRLSLKSSEDQLPALTQDDLSQDGAGSAYTIPHLVSPRGNLTPTRNVTVDFAALLNTGRPASR